MDWTFLNSTHPVYDACKDAWLRDERRLLGGDDVLDELRRFDWEEEKGEHYEARKSEAIYVNFAALFADAMVGHLMREAPPPDRGLSFGRLGKVARATGQATPSRAELIYYNADGIGNDGSQWDAFWAAAMRRAMATGHRWIMAEASREAPASLADEIRGRRPYLLEFSPLEVPMWHLRAGQLQFAIARPAEEGPSLEGNSIVGLGEDRAYLLMVRKGFGGFDALGTPAQGERKFSAGGWWLVDSELEQVTGSGDWAKTGGEIPMWPLFYERSRGTDERAAISRSATMELGQMGIALMNQLSAANFDTWDAGASKTFLLGVDEPAFNLAASKLKSSQLVPVPANAETGQVPQLQDGSQGAVVEGVFRSRIEQIEALAEKAASREAVSTPGSSGISKQAGFSDVRAPRLALMASELETAQNAAIYFLERRFGIDRPQGSVRWPREFDLLTLVDDIREVFELEGLAGIRSATLDASAMTAAIREKGVVADEQELQAIEEEYRQSAADRQTASAQSDAFSAAVRGALGAA